MRAIKEFTSSDPLSKRDRYYLQAAMGMAAVSESRQQHGAVIVHSGKVLGTGANWARNPPAVFGEDTESILRNASVHAEMDALSKIKHKHIPGGRIYVARVNRRGQSRLSRPCNQCFTKLYEAGITTYVYTLDE